MELYNLYVFKYLNYRYERFNIKQMILVKVHQSSTYSCDFGKSLVNSGKMIL